MNKRIEELEKLIGDANVAYYSDTSEILDEQYDAWKDELRELAPDHILLVAVGALIADKSHWKKQKHIIPMSSLDKVNSEEQLIKWMSTRVQTEFCVQEKLDGLSLSIDVIDGNLVSATTRGDGIVGENILRNVLKMQGVPKKVLFSSGKAFTGSVRGEIILKKSLWKQFFADVSNPRNGASGISRRLDGDGVEHLCFMAYDLITDDEKITSEFGKLYTIQELGFGAPNFYICEDFNTIITKRDEFINTLRDGLDYDIDGIVIKIDNIILQESFGRSSGLVTGNPNGQVAFKFANEMRETIVKNIIWDLGRSGRVTPVAEFEPILLSGASITRASLYNFRNVQNLGISIGAKVLVSRRNEVIPAVEKVVQKSDVAVYIPVDCPSCNKSLKVDGEYLVCMNDECSAVIQGNIQKWIDNIQIDSLGPSLVDNLFKSGMVKTLPDLYRLQENKLANLDRLGNKSAAKIIKNLNAKKQMPLHIFLGSLNIPGCGRRVFESLVEQGYDSLDYILSLLPAHFEQVEGVGPKTAQEIYMGLHARKQLINDLLSVGIAIGPFKDIPSVSTKTSGTSVKAGSVKGKSFCFTGAMSQPRSVLESFVSAGGGIAKNAVTGGLDYLVMADANSKTTKAVKARGMGVLTISEEDFLKMVGK